MRKITPKILKYKVRKSKYYEFLHNLSRDFELFFINIAQGQS